MSCFKSGPRSRDLLQQANSERRDLNTQNQQLARKVQQLNDALQLQRQEAGQAQEQQAKLQHFLENEIDSKNRALIECLKTLGTSEHGVKGTLQGVSSDSPEESTPAAIQAFEASHKALCTSLRETRRDLEVTKESNQRLVQEEATAQDQKAKAESKAKRQLEAAEMRSKALEDNNAGLNEMIKELQGRLDQVEKERRDAREKGLAGEDKVQQMQQELDEAHEQADTSRQEVQRLQEELAGTAQNLEHHKRILAATEQRLEKAESMLVEFELLKTQAAQAESDLKATRADLHDTKERLASSTTKSIAQGVEIETLTKRLADHKERKDLMLTQLTQAKGALSSVEAQLQDTNEKYLAAKRELLASNEKLASTLREHHATLEEMSGSGDTLLITNRELKECKKHLEEARQGIDSLRALRREAQQKLREASAELQVLSTHCSSADRDNACKRSLLASIVRLASSFAGQGTFVKDKKGSLESFYQAALAETHMHVKLFDLSMGLVGPLVAGVMDSKSLEQLVVDLDASRELVPEKAGLHLAALSAALSLNASLSTIELLASTWEEQGTGMAAPFLALGCPPPTASPDAPVSNLSSVQVDTCLFSPACASSLTDLLLHGHIELKRPSGEGVLRLYTDHCNLDEWYGVCIQHAPPTTSRRDHGHRLTHAALKQHASSSDTTCNGSGVGNGSDAGHPSGVGPHDDAVQLPPPPVALPEHAPIHADLTQEGLESHHMVMVLAVLLTCPQLKTLRLDGNKVADSGFEILSLGLQHSTTLLELSVCRCMMKTQGARALGQALRVNTALKKLDVSGQRFEGLSRSGTEALAMGLRHNKGLRELGIANNALGTEGAAALAAMLPHNTTLQRIHAASSNGMDEGALRGALQKAAKRADLVIA
uniref:Uncharacterized protein n=1 Tax=Dunaliella tertiolecta TaxID=3047 RepID=A0A7S3VNN1_DUNTE